MFICALIALGTVSLQAGQSNKLLLVVVNRHFTVGKRIPSLYLRVYSNGRTECHTEKSWDEPDIEKHKILSASELQRLQHVLDDPGLPEVEKRYGLMHWVIDSWMEWEISVPLASGTKKIEVLNFAPEAAREKGTPYPPALLKLGCEIGKLRSEVYDGAIMGDSSYLSDDCKAALGAQ